MVIKRKKFSDDNIPTLAELVEEDPLSSEIQPAYDGPIRKQASATIPPVEHTEHYQRAYSEFEITIEAMATEILNRNMVNAHEEITCSILAGIRARLHNGVKPVTMGLEQSKRLLGLPGRIYSDAEKDKRYHDQ
jgi:hypothetical protein